MPMVLSLPQATVYEYICDCPPDQLPTVADISVWAGVAYSSAMHATRILVDLGMIERVKISWRRPGVYRPLVYGAEYSIAYHTIREDVIYPVRDYRTAAKYGY